jgi:hypothetical protein
MKNVEHFSKLWPSESFSDMWPAHGFEFDMPAIEQRAVEIHIAFVKCTT